AKHTLLRLSGESGTAGGPGHVLEYAGEAIKGLSMEGRMTVCNMSIEAGARAGLIAPDEVTYAYVKGRPMAPSSLSALSGGGLGGGSDWDKAIAYWKTLPSDAGAKYDTTITLNTKDIIP